MSDPKTRPTAAGPSRAEPTRPGPARTAHDLRAWETLAERRIREAMEAGEFDDLPFRGERLPEVEDDAWGVAGPVLRRAGVAPPWIETDKAIRALLDEREEILRRAARSTPLGRRRDREAIARIVRQMNDLALRLELQAPTTVQHRRRLDLAEEFDRLDRAAGAVDQRAPGQPRDAGPR